MPGLKALANGGQLLVGASAVPTFLAEQLATLIVAVSHKHTRLPILILRGRTVFCLSWARSRRMLGKRAHEPLVALRLIATPFLVLKTFKLWS